MFETNVNASLRGFIHPRLLKVQSISHFLASKWQPEDVALLWEDQLSLCGEDICALPWGAVLNAPSKESGPLNISSIRYDNPEAVVDDDVIAVFPGRSNVRIAYRRGVKGNVLFTTSRCNSNCVMCSQPPQMTDDSWLIEHNLELLRLIDRDVPELGISGGEPTLLGRDLVRIINAAATKLPETRLHVLTNGRLIANKNWSQFLREIKHSRLSWGVPLYADNPIDHDYVVQAQGAFRETMAGLYSLARHPFGIEIRVVLHRLTIDRLESLAYYIFRNLGFVQHVALMGIEPMGYARNNYNLLYVDLAEHKDTIESAVAFLANRGISVSLYNIPICILPSTVRTYARKSISDWKNVYLDECKLCVAKNGCCGFFKWKDEAWISPHVRSLTMEEVICA